MSAKTLKRSSVRELNLEGITVNIGTNPAQSLVSLTTLNAYLTLFNAVLAKIPTPPTPSELLALSTAFGFMQSGVPSIKTPML